MNNYPHENLYLSLEWKERIQKLKLSPAQWSIHNRYGFKILRRTLYFLEDFEAWPSMDLEFYKQTGADLIEFQKLPQELRPEQIPSLSLVKKLRSSPYIDLKNPLPPKKRAMQDIIRCEKKLIQEKGQLELCLAGENERPTWFEAWANFHKQRRKSLGDVDYLEQKEIYEVFKSWITDAELPGWMKLFSLKAGNETICYGLCYVYLGVFYFQIPTFNPIPELKKFGPGKLFVQKLIDWSNEQNLEIFDFLQGDEEYKFSWNPQIRQLYQCNIPLTLKGRMFYKLKNLKSFFLKKSI